MSDLTEENIKQCSLTLGQFDSETVNLLVTLFHHQNACAQLILLSNNLKEKFENLLTTKKDTEDDITNDTPLTRIELAIMIHFKQKYLTESIIDNDNNQLKSSIKYSIDDELDLAYCFLLAQIDDRLSKEKLDEIKFLLGIQQNIKSLFDIYEKSNEKFPKFFSTLIQCQYFKQNLVIADQLIHAFQLFIKRYEDFLQTFEKYYKISSDTGNNYTQTDAILNQNNTNEISSFMTKFLSLNREQIKSPSSPPLDQFSKPSIPRPLIQQSSSPPPISSNIPQKALCVIINITAFISSQSIHTPRRAGSEKDVDLIKVVFNKLNFVVLECKYDFKKIDLERALDHINDKNIYGNFDCLVMFIMSHGLLHSFFTADSKEIVIRDIVKRYTDSSPTSIWTGKPRLFFIQACRSLWPEHVQCPNREEIKSNDLSPRMLVAYSCSPNEASKRSPTAGSIFIQILCIMLLRYGHYLHIHTILEWTAKFVIKRDEYSAECRKTQISIQRPEYIEKEFSPNFRFANHCLYDKYQLWSYDKKITLNIPLRIWREIYDLIFANVASGR